MAIVAVFCLMGISCIDEAVIYANAAKVAAAKEALSIPAETEIDLDLPLDLDGVAISWASSDEEVISNTGIVTRQPYETQVTLTATLSFGKIVDTKEFPVIVPDFIMNIDDAIKVALAKEALFIPAETENDLDLSADLNSVTISWSSSNEDVISSAGVVTRQLHDTDVTLTATLSFGDAVDTKEFTVRVLAAEETEDLAEYKEDAKTNLTAYVEALESDGYSNEVWTVLERIVNLGKENIDIAENKQVVDSILKMTKDNIDTLDKGHRYFVLTISAEETTIQQGEKFKVNVELKNKSGEDYEVFFDYLFFPYIPGWHIYHDYGLSSYDIFGKSKSILEAGSILQHPGTSFQNNEWELGSALKLGNHELKFRAEFYFNWGQEDQQRIEVWSNTIILTVQ